MINKLKNELNKEKNKNKKLLEESDKLKYLLNEKNKNFNLFLEKNNNEIFKLNLKLSKYPLELLDGEKLLFITFMSYDENIIKNIIWKNIYKLIYLEKQLYKDYPEYFNFKYYFTKNGKKINKYINLDENEIYNNDNIILNIDNKI